MPEDAVTKPGIRPILDVRDVRVSYGDFDAVKGISFAVSRGAAVGVVGANGAGKSSLFRAIAGLQPISAGTVEFDGQVARSRRNAWTLARQGLRLVPEGREIFSGLSVRENLRVGLMLTPRDDRAAALEEVLKLFPVLAERSSQTGGSLSGGQQQMLAVARACIGRPRLLMLDEPSLGLAPKIVQSLREALERIRASGVAVLIADQGLGIVREFCDEVHVVRLGKIISSGPVDTLRGETLSDAFLA